MLALRWFRNHNHICTTRGFQEIFMRDQRVNPEGYETSAAINYAEGLRGKLLIVTGSGETNTHIQIIEGLVDRLIELGKPFDYWVYPNRDHGCERGRERWFTSGS